MPRVRRKRGGEVSDNTPSVEVPRKCATCRFADWFKWPIDHEGACVDTSHPLGGWYRIYRKGNGKPPDSDTGTGCPCWQAKGER
jgi:hypothetical protein